eukprot:6192592-Pleurochrysis_carterae.AAC.1
MSRADARPPVTCTGSVAKITRLVGYPHPSGMQSYPLTLYPLCTDTFDVRHCGLRNYLPTYPV